jgi:geranylgeranyl diphosphate synthase, type I
MAEVMRSARLDDAIADSPAVPSLTAGNVQQVVRGMRAGTPPLSSFTGLMTAYHMGWVDRDGRPVDAQSSKLVRSSLCLWACAAAGADSEHALPVAMALEWVHNATLIHDDIQDEDRERRSRETVWSIWGMGQGINAGDALYGMAFERLLAPGPHAGRRFRAGRALAGAMCHVLEGQCLDLSMEGHLRTSPTAYLRMARAKTGALLGASLQTGATVGGAAAAVASRLRQAGELLGLAFQVRDDWLGIWGDPSLTGKSRDRDLRRRKVTYPVIAGYAAMTPRERRTFRARFAADDATGEPAVHELRVLLERKGADRLAAVACHEFAEQAIDLVATCGFDHQHTGQFKEFARYVANRSR